MGKSVQNGVARCTLKVTKLGVLETGGGENLAANSLFVLRNSYSISLQAAKRFLPVNGMIFWIV